MSNCWRFNSPVGLKPGSLGLGEFRASPTWLEIGSSLSLLLDPLLDNDLFRDCSGTGEKFKICLFCSACWLCCNNWMCCSIDCIWSWDWMFEKSGFCSESGHRPGIFWPIKPWSRPDRPKRLGIAWPSMLGGAERRSRVAWSCNCIAKFWGIPPLPKAPSLLPCKNMVIIKIRAAVFS